ncbi:Arylsulfatase B, partial [Stegodyphus mimosarum]
MKYVLGVSILFLRVVYLTAARENFQPPNIIIIYADDLGWNDVSFHGSPQIKTPNLDALAASGIILNGYYGEYMCTPSRAALMTGKYPMRLGLQHHIIAAGEASALPLHVMTMPEHFRKLGYATHMVGKWHLGYMKRNYTPIYRGFDTFLGYYNGLIDYYDYETFETMTSMKQFIGVDLHNGTTLIKHLRGEYATHLFTRTATNIIYNHDTSKPLFLYLAEISPHIGNSYDPLQAPLEIIEKFSYIKHE